MKRALILVGHGGVPSDYPRHRLRRLRQLESARLESGGVMSPEERDLDDDIRNWPRTPLTDPYQAGLENLADHLRPRLGDCRLELAYNEFCAPSLESMVGRLAAAEYTDLDVVSSMFTPGGSHSEIEIPELLDLLRQRHPSVRLRYHWPYDLNRVSDVILDKVRPFKEVLR